MSLAQPAMSPTRQATRWSARRAAAIISGELSSPVNSEAVMDLRQEDPVARFTRPALELNPFFEPADRILESSGAVQGGGDGFQEEPNVVVHNLYCYGARPESARPPAPGGFQEP
jgi:hypothetical protein